MRGDTNCVEVSCGEVPESRVLRPPQPTISGWWTLLEVVHLLVWRMSYVFDNNTAHGDRVDSDMVALNRALIRVTRTGELLTCARMLKVAMLTGEAEEEIDGRSSQFKVTSTLHLSLCVTSVPFGWRYSYRRVNPSLFASTSK